MYPHTKKQLLVEAIDLVGLIQSVVGDRPYQELQKEVVAGIAAISRNLRDTLEALHDAEVEISAPEAQPASRQTVSGTMPTEPVSKKSSEPTAVLELSEKLPTVEAISNSTTSVLSTSKAAEAVASNGAPIIRRQTMQVGQSKLRDFGGSAQTKH